MCVCVCVCLCVCVCVCVCACASVCVGYFVHRLTGIRKQQKEEKCLVKRHKQGCV